MVRPYWSASASAFCWSSNSSLSVLRSGIGRRTLFPSIDCRKFQVFFEEVAKERVEQCMSHAFLLAPRMVLAHMASRRRYSTSATLTGVLRHLFQALLRAFTAWAHSSFHQGLPGSRGVRLVERRKADLPVSSKYDWNFTAASSRGIEEWCISDGKASWNAGHAEGVSFHFGRHPGLGRGVASWKVARMGM